MYKNEWNPIVEITDNFSRGKVGLVSLYEEVVTESLLIEEVGRVLTNLLI